MGPKAGASRLRKYGTPEAVLEARSDTLSPTVAAELRVFKHIVSMQSDVAVELPRTAPPNGSAAAAELERLGARNSAERLQARAAARG